MPFMQQRIWIFHTVFSSPVHQLMSAWTFRLFFCSCESEAMSLLLTMPNDDSGLLSWLGIVCLKMSWDLKLSSTHHYERLVRAIVHCAGSLKLDYWAFVPHHVWTDPATPADTLCRSLLP